MGRTGLVLGLLFVGAALVVALTGGRTRAGLGERTSRPALPSPCQAGQASPSLPRPARSATPFAPDSIWNAPLPADAPVASNSTALVADLERQVRRYGAWINTDSYSTPIYTVPASQPCVPVTLDVVPTYPSAAELARAFGAGVPIPSDARPAPGSDRDLVVWQPATDTMWELWNARRVNGVWHARWGGRLNDVSKNPGYFTDPPDWGTAATSLALLGGTARISELRAGHIDHALAISIPEARRGVVIWPAQRTDGSLASPHAIPEGTRLRLDPNLDLNALKLPPLTRMIAEAAQRYGLLVRDQSGAVAFYGEQVTQSGPNPYTGPSGIFGNLSPQQLTAAFPWSHLEVVSAPVRPYQ